MLALTLLLLFIELSPLVLTSFFSSSLTLREK
jgi:hypothetical protein